MNRSRKPKIVSVESNHVTHVPLSLKRRKKLIPESSTPFNKEANSDEVHQESTPTPSSGKMEVESSLSNEPILLKSEENATKSVDVNVSPTSELSTPPSSPRDAAVVDSSNSATVEENQTYASTVVLSKTGRMSIAVHHAGKKHLVKFARSTSNNDIIRVMNRMCGVTKENQDRVTISVVQPGSENKASNTIEKINELIKTVKTTPFLGHGELHLTTSEVSEPMSQVKPTLDSSTSLENFVVQRPAKKRKVEEELLDLQPHPRKEIENSSGRSIQPAGVVGLANLKNTCFANSVLQSLSNCSNFREFLIGNLHVPVSTPSDFVLVQMIRLFHLMWSGQHELLSPISLISTLQTKVNLEIGVEEDAHWFLQILLQILDEELLNANLFVNGVSELFDTRKRSELLCPKCHEVTRETENRNMINTLPLLEDEDSKHSICTLDECLRMWTEDTDNGLCRTCNSEDSNLSYQRKIAITQLPPILCLHFNRYRWTGKVINRATRSGAKGKINTKVIFPIKLDMSKYLSFKADRIDRENAQYNLVAVVVHDGLTPATGHYYTYCFNNLSRHWYKFDDDQKPTLVTENQVLKANPFMLFYQPAKGRILRSSSSQTVPKKGTTFLDEVL